MTHFSCKFFLPPPAPPPPENISYMPMSEESQDHRGDSDGGPEVLLHRIQSPC